MKANNIISVLIAACCLNSCYFNSAGHIFDRAEYAAALSTYGIEANKGGKVYTDGNSYYIDVRMCRYDKPIRTQYDAFEQKSKQDEDKRVSRVVMRTAEIPEDFAKYLMGKASSPKRPSYMKLAKSSVKKKCEAYPIVKTPEIVDEFFQYKSPGAVGYYTLGVLDWLCVDLPITCVENALAIPCYTLGAFLGGLGEGLGKMGHAFNESAARINTYNRNTYTVTPQNSYGTPINNFRYAPPLQTPSYSAPVTSSAGYAPPLQSSTSYNSSNVPTSSYSSGRNVTMEQLESQRQLNAHFREINEENLRIRKESFNRIMNSINRDSSIKYVP